MRARAAAIFTTVAAVAIAVAPAVAAAASEDLTFGAAGAERHAIISPPAAPGAKTPPVVLVFPREGTTARDALDRFAYSIHRAGAVAVALDALPCATLGGQPCWAPMQPDRQPADFTAVTELLNRLDTRTDIDSTRLVTLGESSGAAFSVLMTRALPSRIDGSLAISAFDSTRSVSLDPTTQQVVFPVALGGTSTIRSQRNRQHITLMRGSADTTIPPALTMQLRDRLATAGWNSRLLSLVTVGGATHASPALAAPRRITPRLRDLIRHTLDLDVPTGQVRRLSALGYLPPKATPGNTSRYALSQAIMAFQGWNGLPRDGVVGAATATRLAVAGRPVPRRRGGGTWLEGDIGKQVVLLVRGGKVVRAIHFSSGSAGNTPRGTFTIFRKERMSWSIPFRSWMPYASYFTGGFAFHEYPDVPGYPASHGCVRIAAPFAPYLYDFARYGTPVHMY
jgi:dienelactone hydrolase